MVKEIVKKLRSSKKAVKSEPEVEEKPVVKERVVAHLDRDPNDPRNVPSAGPLPSLDD